MKKTIQKPENWQDFESLCKKLWGEIWEIPMKIKKNGRQGQPQAGVDIYGIPKNKNKYWGIQCKGKDEYANAKLTKKEINKEIGNAKKFKPELAVFIFATTMNKDSKIEEYIREKDLESRESGKFEILLFCWEDIADLITENKDTFNYYVSDKQHKEKYEFIVYLNDFQSEISIQPVCIREIRRYRLKEVENLNVLRSIPHRSIAFPTLPTIQGQILADSDRFNEAICQFEIIMVNTGSMVIEDWRVALKFVGEHKDLMDDLGGDSFLLKLGNRRTYVDGNTIHFTPNKNQPLIQKDNEYFEAYIIPECKEYTIPIHWELLARDYDSNGEILLKVEPEYEDRFIYVDVDTEEEIKDDEIISVEEKKNYSDD